MEFGFTERQNQLMEEIREFLIKELPEDYDPTGSGMLGVMLADKESEDFWHQFHLKGVEKGWPTVGWPKKYGGLGMSALEQGAINAEMSYWGATWGGGMSMFLVAPTILATGTEEQKQRWIPPIVRGEIVSFEAFTEPDAGSDEANMQMKAIKDGDFYVLNGQKTFISGSQKPDWLYTLARTADTVPKHRGLKMFMVDANAPGLTYRPLPTMAGSMQNEIFYDNVRVPKENMLGEEGRGFYLAMTTFEFERAGGNTAPVKRALERIVDYYRLEMRNGQPLIKEPKVRKLIAKQAIQHHIEFLIEWEQAWRQSEREKAKTSSIKRYEVGPHFQKEWVPQVSRGLLGVFGGLYTQLKKNSKYAKPYLNPGQRFEAMHSIHAAGSPEIRKTVLAERGLGLPRVPRRYDAMIYKAIQNGEK
jgi:alkylation response protein AidB-like acyl-CoA dehydrogenase